MSLQLLTIVYGDAHLDRFRRGTLQSLSWKKNLSALHAAKAIYNIFTEDKHFDFLRKVTDAYLPELPVRLISTSELRDYTDPVQSALVWQIGQCIKTNSQMLMCPPDTIYGAGSIEGMLGVGWEAETCVAVAHPRVLPTILDDLKLQLNNAELVSMAWRHLHRSWSEAEVGCVNQNSFVGGVAWKKIAMDVISVQHRLPTVYLASFTREDESYFKTVVSSGHWDHRFPGDILFPRGRMRYVGSSDAAFLCEITEGTKNVPPIIPGADPTKFWKQDQHNEINKQIAVIFRGEAI